MKGILTKCHWTENSILMTWALSYDKIETEINGLKLTANFYHFIHKIIYI